MARNEEKAQAMLNRWYKMKRDLRNAEMGKYRDAPEIEKCISIQDCEFERMELLKVISKKVSEIQNAGLGEHRIRELNDEINKVIKEKQKWETRIKELGGPDYRRISAKMIDSQSLELPGGGGYKYFGSAKDLPGVRELFMKDVPYEPKKSRSELYKTVSYEYYGFSAQFDKELLEEEQKVERAYRLEELKRFCAENQQIVNIYFDGLEPSEDQIVKFVNSDSLQEEEHYEDDQEKKQHIEQEIDREVLERRKKEIVEKYLKDEEKVNLFAQFEEPRDMENEEMAKQIIKMNMNNQLQTL